MTLIADVSKKVSGAIRERGRQYFQSGAVVFLEGDSKNVMAKVQGSAVYDVILTRKKKNLLVSCSCPYFDSNFDTCKHIWATILAAESRGLLRGSGPLNLEPVSYDYGDKLKDDLEEEDRDLDDEDPFDLDELPSIPFPTSRSTPQRPRKAKTKADEESTPPPPLWKMQLMALRLASASQANSLPGIRRRSDREIVYLLNVPRILAERSLVVEMNQRKRKQNGEWSKPKPHRIDMRQIDSLPEFSDQQILTLLNGSTDWSYYSYSLKASQLRLSQRQLEILLPMMCRTGRCALRVSEPSDPIFLTWDDAGDWQFWVEVVRDEAEKQYQLQGALRRNNERMDLTEATLVLRGGFVFWNDRVAKVQDSGAFDLMAMLRKERQLSVPFEQGAELVQDLFQLGNLPRLDLPEELRFEEVTMPPKPRLRIRHPTDRYWQKDRLAGELHFAYDGQIVPADCKEQFIFQLEPRRLIRRNRDAESTAVEQLRIAGFRQSNSYSGLPELWLPTRKLPRVVPSLVAAGWHVEAEGKLYRQPGALHVQVQSGVDWFELNGTVEYGNTKAKLPELLAALKRGENIVRLDDGSFGMLPEEWLKKYGVLAGLGTAKNGQLRFQKNQVGLLDAMLASQPDVTCDEVFIKAREELQRFDGIQPTDSTEGFVGELRGYQRDGLGWLYFLQKFGFGGCLADDMGLGKTVQVLALLESRRTLRCEFPKKNHSTKDIGTSLAVVPKSLIFNWKQEAARFAPKLRVLDHTGMDRLKPGEHFQDYDLVITFMEPFAATRWI